MNKHLKKAISILTLFPVSSFAAETFFDVAGIFGSLMQTIIALLVGAGVLWVAWAVFKYIKEGSENPEMKMAVVHAIVGLFIMVSIWGLVNVLTGTFDLDNASPWGNGGGSSEEGFSCPASEEARCTSQHPAGDVEECLQFIRENGCRYSQFQFPS